MEGALEDLARISGKQLPYYSTAAEEKNRYNQYDQYIIGWSEYYKYKYGVYIDPVITKSQLYNETRIGYTEAESAKIPATNASRDIMQALDIRNYNLYNYTEISPEQFVAGTLSGEKMTGLEIWNLNLGKKGYEAPKGGISNRDAYDRCKGIVATLFKPVEGDTPYRFVYSNVTEVMSIGIGMDHMMDLILKHGYTKALEEYNGKTPNAYREDILNRAGEDKVEGD